MKDSRQLTVCQGFWGLQSTGNGWAPPAGAFSAAGHIARKSTHVQDAKIAPTKQPPPILFRFPRNSDNKIPLENYTQVREWFKRAIKPEPEKSDADKQEFWDLFPLRCLNLLGRRMPPLIGDHAQAINSMITTDVAVEEDTVLGHPALSAITIIITSMMAIAIPDPGPQHNNQGQTGDCQFCSFLSSWRLHPLHSPWRLQSSVSI